MSGSGSSSSILSRKNKTRSTEESRAAKLSKPVENHSDEDLVVDEEGGGSKRKEQTIVIIKYIAQHEVENGEIKMKQKKGIDDSDLTKICHLTGLTRSVVVQARHFWLSNINEVLYASGFSNTPARVKGVNTWRDLFEEAPSINDVVLSPDAMKEAYKKSISYRGGFPHRQCLYYDDQKIVQLGDENVINNNRHDMYGIYRCPFKVTTDSILKVCLVPAIVGTHFYRDAKNVEQKLNEYAKKARKNVKEIKVIRKDNFKNATSEQQKTDLICRPVIDMDKFGFPLDVNKMEIMFLVVGARLADIFKDGERECLLAAYTENCYKKAKFSPEVIQYVNSARKKHLVELSKWKMDIELEINQNIKMLFSMIIKSEAVQQGLLYAAVSIKDIVDNQLHYKLNINNQELLNLLDEQVLEKNLILTVEDKIKLYIKQ